ncbi:uncharacterized protein involved in response to NO [Mariprofundus ferrinatatus]|uniref:Uncharacterized protein involved in response to NO n=1 Tax=Mariprofundus ferrinatatus TaxID=1921087 RepID=A0A2K8L1I4_9PROT|nr:uncharacterized protein involved in response to NO [Mariprofundus ferrinatatus]
MINISNGGSVSTPKRWSPFALGFRPFFLLAGWFATLFMATSLGGFVSGIWHYNYFELSLWHAHEMLFGFGVAVIAGFLLTAVRNWTGLATPSGLPLALLVLLWLAPRVLSAVPMPAMIFALLDMLFLPVLALLIYLRVKQAKQPHNYSVPALLLLLAVANAGIHLDLLGQLPGVSSGMLHLGVLTFVAIIVLIGGRVVPFFIGSATASQAGSKRWIEKAALPSVMLFAGVNLLLPVDGLVAVLAVAVGLLHAKRMQQWYVASIWKEPMLWVLYLGYAWLVAGFFFYAAALMFNLPLTEAVHAWTVGAIGAFTLGMMARVSLGHTGRPVQALPWMPAGFILIVAAAFARVVMPLINPAWLDSIVMFSATCWIIAFLIFAIRYSMLLLKPRLDGKEG